MEYKSLQAQEAYWSRSCETCAAGKDVDEASGLCAACVHEATRYCTCCFENVKGNGLPYPYRNWCWICYANRREV